MVKFVRRLISWLQMSMKVDRAISKLQRLVVGTSTHPLRSVCRPTYPAIVSDQKSGRQDLESRRRVGAERRVRHTRKGFDESTGINDRVRTGQSRIAAIILLPALLQFSVGRLFERHLMAVGEVVRFAKSILKYF